MFSSRVPPDLSANRLAAAIDTVKRDGRPFIDLTLSNPTQAGFDYPADLLAPLADVRALRRYEPEPFGSMAARQAIAREYARAGAVVDPRRIVLTASTSDAYSVLFKLLADPGDEVLVPRPSYPLFEHLAQLDAVETKAYSLEYHGRWTIDFGSIERALTPRTRALIIVSPNNPTGSFVSRDELDRVIALCEARDVAIVSDEVFAAYELEPGAFAAAGRTVDADCGLVFALGGLSKSVGLPQVKLGWMVAAGRDDLVADALVRLELICDTYLSVSTPAQTAAAELLIRGAAIREQIAARVRANYDRLQSATANAPACRTLRSEGGWYATVQVPTYESEEDLVVRLLTNDAVLTHPGYFFDFPRESFLVVSLLGPEAAFQDGVARVLRHFTCKARG